MSYESNHLLYDYYNFPEEMYKVKFQSRGSPAVASRVVELLKQVCLCPRDLKLTVERDTNTDVETRTGFRSRCVCPIQVNVPITMSNSYHRSLHGRHIRPTTSNRPRKSINAITVFPPQFCSVSISSVSRSS